MSKLTDYLNNLEILDLIARQKSDPDLEYAFKHVFTQESVYGSLLYSDRRQIHQQVGEALEAVLADHLHDGEIALMLAYHFEQSGDRARALKYLKQAADDARATFANQEARSLYNRALALLNRDDYAQRWEILVDQEIILDRMGERDQQADTLTQMQTLAELTQDDPRLAITHNRRSAYFDKISEYRASAEAAEVGLRIARRSGNAALQAESLNLLALAAWRRFDYPQVQKWATDALDALKVSGTLETRVASLFHLGRASYRLGQYDVAQHYLQAAHDLTRSMDNREGEATSHLVLGWIYQRLGDYDLAAEHYQAKLELRRMTGSRYGEATALSHLGWLAYDQHNPQAGLDYCQQALDISRSVNDRENESYALSGFGLNYEQLEQFELASANYQAALAIHQDIGATTLTVFDLAGLARLALAQDNLDEACRHITTVVDWIQAGNAQKFWDPWIIYQSGYRVLTALGDTDQANAILNEAHGILQQRTNEISDTHLRNCFLTKVAVNREIVAAWQQAQRPQS
ncbi:MAG: tetratricopeptide repeat protein [Anaerolineae bacterium]|nr:tetratricopeptide repeat protein [Anaerolineae bacterium]